MKKKKKKKIILLLPPPPPIYSITLMCVYISGLSAAKNK